MSIIIAILVLCALVTIHEFGHFLAGRRAGIAVTEFAIGFGPKLVKWNRKGTEFSIRLLPLGGFCKFLGEDEDVEAADSFNNASLWGRVKTVAAGPLFNIFMAIVIAAVMIIGYGNRTSNVGSIIPGSSAEQAGMETGDIILSVNGKETLFLGQASAELATAGDTGIAVTVDRDGTEMNFTLDKTPLEVEETTSSGETQLVTKNLVGINMGVGRLHFGFFQSLWVGLKWTFFFLGQMISGLGLIVSSIFTGVSLQGAVMGPAGTISFIAEAARTGLENILMLASVLSINLGLVNLLPLPALDGGRLVFFLIEAVRGKPISPDKEGWVHMIGFAALMLLMVVLTYNDIRTLLNGGFGI